jgi:hypothetical protein
MKLHLAGECSCETEAMVIRLKWDNLVCVRKSLVCIS